MAALARVPEHLEPLLVADLVEPLNDELVALLRRLAPEDWECPTLSRRWRVKEVAAHILDGHLRRLAVQRDGLRLPAPAEPIAGFEDLVRYLDGLNATWIEAARHLSPRLLTDLLALSGPWVAALFAALDPFAPAIFPVAWAEQEESPCWLDHARDLSEHWHHQQQIRLAVGEPLLLEPRFAVPVLEAFLRSVPHAYREIAAREGTLVSIEITDPVARHYALVRRGGGWALGRGPVEAPAARIALDAETAWRVLTRSLTGQDARGRVAIDGREDLALPLLAAKAIMV